MLLAFILLAGTFVTSNAQDDKDDTHGITVIIPEVAILDIETAAPSKNLNMPFTIQGTGPIGEAGAGLGNPPSNEVIWLNYTSVVMPSGLDHVRKVGVKTSVPTPGGVTFTVEADPASGSMSAGTLGIGGTQVSLSTVQFNNFITGIGSCYTGDGANNGHRLKYRVSAPAPGSGPTFGLLVAGSYTITVTYTLSDNP